MKNGAKQKFFCASCLIFLLMLTLNLLFPVVFGDDYVYSFVWDGISNGGNLYQPLSENARRIETFSDVLYSQWIHYFTWGGRVLAQFLTQLFLWLGKDVFSFANASLYVILVWEIAWISYGGKISLTVPFSRFCIIFFALWAFTPVFNVTAVWLTGACNYPWMAALQLAFILPFVNWYLHPTTDDSQRKRAGIFLLGISAGCTNEHIVCWLVLLMGLVLWREKKEAILPRWLYYGYGGLCLGYCILILAPGNFLRQTVERQQSLWEKMTILLLVLFVQSILIYFIIRTKRYYRKRMHQEEPTSLLSVRLLDLIDGLAFLSVASNLILLLAPTFPLRAAFNSSVFLVTAGALLLQLEQKQLTTAISATAKRFFYAVGAIYVLITYSFSVWNLYNLHCYMDYVAREAKRAKEMQEPLVVASWPKERAMLLLLMHRVDVTLNTDPSGWKNVSCARYFGISSVSASKDLVWSNKQTPQTNECLPIKFFKLD